MKIASQKNQASVVVLRTTTGFNHMRCKRCEINEKKKGWGVYLPVGAAPLYPFIFGAGHLLAAPPKIKKHSARGSASRAGDVIELDSGRIKQSVVVLRTTTFLINKLIKREKVRSS